MIGYAGGDGRGAVDDILDAFGSFGVGAFYEDIWNSDEGDVGVSISPMST
jgi:hypothetical protein